VPGLLRDFPDESTLIPLIDPERVQESMAHAKGRMRIKVLGAIEALREGRTPAAMPRVRKGFDVAASAQSQSASARWTPERRAAQSERLRALRLARKAK
jgi:acetylglutamate kinase